MEKPTAEKIRGELPDPTRRMLLIGIPAAAIVAGGVGSLVARALREDDAPPDEAPAEETPKAEAQSQKSPLKILTPEQKRNAYRSLRQRYPQLRANPYHLFELEDEEAYRFLEACSFQDLRNFGILRGAEQPFEYMDLEKVWQRAVRLNPGRDPYRRKSMAARNEKHTLHSLSNGIRRAIKRFAGGILKNADLDNGFSDHITPELMLAIFVQEIAPGEMPGHLKIKPKARLELFRMMCEAGWQPQKMPALYDTAISFGLGQMTLPTHEGLQRAHGAETNGIVEHDFQKHTSSDQQIAASLLLAYDNLNAFYHIAKECQGFLRAFESAADEQKKRFLTTVLAAYHNYGNRSSLRRRIRLALGHSHEDLERYRMEFLTDINSLSAYRHARNSGALYSFIANRAATIAPALAREDRELPPPPPRLSVVEKDIAEDTLLVRIKQHPETGAPMGYYTFTAPHADLGIILSYILKGATVEDVKRFQGVARYTPGDAIHLLLAYLPEDMRDRRFAIIPTQGKRPLELMEQYMKGGTSPRNRCLAILYGTTHGELRFPASLLKE